MLIIWSKEKDITNIIRTKYSLKEEIQIAKLKEGQYTCKFSIYLFIYSAVNYWAPIMCSALEIAWWEKHMLLLTPGTHRQAGREPAMTEINK